MEKFSSHHGVWLSVDLMLAFLLIQLTLSLALSPLLLEQVYARERAANAQQLSSLLSVSHRLYTSAVASSGASAWVGYYDSGSVSPGALGLPEPYLSSLPSLISDTLPSTPSSSRLCIQRVMLNQKRPFSLWVCAPSG